MIAASAATNASRKNFINGLPNRSKSFHARTARKLNDLPRRRRRYGRSAIQEILKTGHYSLPNQAAQKISGNDPSSSWICSRSRTEKSRVPLEHSKRERWSKKKLPRERAEVARFGRGSEKRAKKIFLKAIEVHKKSAGAFPHRLWSGRKRTKSFRTSAHSAIPSEGRDARGLTAARARNTVGGPRPARYDFSGKVPHPKSGGNRSHSISSIP